jgi:hypothetical protein
MRDEAADRQSPLFVKDRGCFQASRDCGDAEFMVFYGPMFLRSLI